MKVICNIVDNEIKRHQLIIEHEEPLAALDVGKEWFRKTYPDREIEAIELIVAKEDRNVSVLFRDMDIVTYSVMQDWRIFYDDDTALWS